MSLLTPARVVSPLAVLGLLAGAIVGTDQAASAEQAGHQEPSMAGQFIDQINSERAANHRPRLTVSRPLMASAASWAEAMARTNVLAHNPHLATSVTGWKYLGENVGVGYSVSSLESAFWASAPHRDNMLDPDYTQVGLAVVDIGGKLWVAEEFSRPLAASSSTSGRAGAAHPARPTTARPTTAERRARTQRAIAAAQRHRGK
jgi:uncharacterized protein YkwD